MKTLQLCDSLAGLSWASRSTALGFSLAGLSWASGSNGPWVSLRAQFWPHGVQQEKKKSQGGDGGHQVDWVVTGGEGDQDQEVQIKSS